MKKNKYTISDIAKMLGVSRSTVSKAMNNAPGVGPEVRKRILDFIEEVGYKPNTLARGLSIGSINIVALIFGDVRNPFYSDLAFYIQKMLNEQGYMVMVFNSEYQEEKEIEFIKIAEQFNFAGLILITAQSDKLKETLKEIDIPIVLVNRTFDDFEGDAVFLDNYAAGYIATKHLMELGHQRIGFIAGYTSSSSIRQRVKGYRQLLKDYNLPHYEEDEILGQLNFETGYNIALEVIRDIRNKPSGFVIANDMSALGFIDCCKRNGIKIPEMISVVSFDNTLYASLKDIELTTVSQHVEEMSKVAARLMIKRLKNPDAEPEKVMLEPTLMIRGTTGLFNPMRFANTKYQA